MFTVIDVDSHWELYGSSADELHFGELNRYMRQFPDVRDYLMTNMAKGMVQSAPAEHRPSAADLFPDGGRWETFVVDNPPHRRLGASNLDDRLRWMDAVGIDAQLVNHGRYAAIVDYLDDADERRNAMALCNDYLADQLAPSGGKLKPATLLDFTDPDWSAAEIRRMRQRGSRTFAAIASPVGGISPAHSRYDVVWKAACESGMVGILHAGNEPINLTGWSNVDWEMSDTGATGLLRFNVSMRAHAAQLYLSALVFGGVLERFPALTMIIEEYWIGWFPWYLRRHERLADSVDDIFGVWPFELSPADQLRRNVRLSPLPGMGDSEAYSLLAAAPDMFVFSSDYPHSEGNADPIGAHGSNLDGIDQAIRAKFLGGNIAACFDRMGAPLTV